MKRTCLGHPKLRRLCRVLGVRLYAGVGILESLWHFTGRFALIGDVGRYTDADIAEAVDWDGDAHQLVEALVEAGWLDRHPTLRLVVHDIQHHADNSWRQNLTDCGLTWWDGSPPRLDRIGRPRTKTPDSGIKTPEAGIKTPAKLQLNSSKTPQPEPKPEPKPKPDNISSTDVDSSAGNPASPTASTGRQSLNADAKDLAAGWNQYVADPCSLPAVTLPLAPKRLAKTVSRLREHPDPDWWLDVFTAIRGSPFLLGSSTQGWKITFDWLVANDTNATKVLEGHYDRTRRSA